MSVEEKYIEVLDYLVQPKGHDHSGDKTICYLTFGSDQIQDVKQKLNQSWLDLAKHKGLDLKVLSLREVIKEFFSRDEYRIEAGKDAVGDEIEMTEVYESLGENLKNQGVLEAALMTKQAEVKSTPGGVLLITDVEAIHPFTRFGPIEQRIYGKVEVPIVVLYPGEISGSALKFLGFYPEDGNYRSKHF